MKKITIVWIIPILAAFACYFSVKAYFDSKGPEIEVLIPSADGIQAGKTEVKYNGIPVGKVINLDVTNNLDYIILKIELLKKAEGIAQAGSKFWIVEPEITGLRGLKNIDTLVSGKFIATEPPDGATKGSPISKTQYRFTAVDAPIKADDKESANDLKIRVIANNAFAMEVGSGVFYKGDEVGFIKNIKLNTHGQNVIAYINIYNEYRNLVRTNSIFWDQTTFKVKFGFDGIRFKGNIFDKVVNFGSISFATPNEAGQRIGNGYMFNIASVYDEEWLNWNPTLY